jgi:hypothetical protein
MKKLNSVVLAAFLTIPTLLVACGGTTGDDTSDAQPGGSSAQGGAAGSGAGGKGAGGDAGSGAMGGSAGSGTAGSGTAGSGTAGSGTAGSGTAGSGTAGSGTAGSGTAGSGTAGSGTAGSGTAGSGSAGAGGQTSCNPGDTEPAPDGCNTCTCQDDGSWACTEKACPPACTGEQPPCEQPPPGCDYQDGGCVNGEWTCGTLNCGGQCKPGDTQLAPDGCNTCTCLDDGSWACTKELCTSECTGGPPPCAAPPVGCDYVGAGCIDSQWTCGDLVCEAQCKDDSECPAIKMPCQACPAGGVSCPQSVCVNSTCEISWSACPGVGPGLACEKPGAQVPADDGCNTCTCGDNLQWGCTKLACPDPVCKQDSDCPPIKAPCELCSDGSTSCPSSTCVNGQCEVSWPGCSDPCAAQDAAGTGLCAAFLGYAWNGKDCVGLSGCSCVGADCSAIYKDPSECKVAHESCQPCVGGPPPCAAPPDGCNYEGGGCVGGKWTCGTLVCDAQCKADSDCPQPGAPCQVCSDGSTSCPSAQCIGGQCQVSFPGCPEACGAQKITGVGDCKKLLGFAWDGTMCAAIDGCECAGDCKGLFDSQAACDKAYAACQ